MCQVREAREKEERCVWESAKLAALNSVLITASPVLVALITFAIFYALGACLNEPFTL